jgi:hypothetical protein
MVPHNRYPNDAGRRSFANLTERVPLESPGSIGAFFLAIVLVDKPISVAARQAR